MGFGWVRVHYVLLYAVIGAYLPYMPLFLHERGMADWQIGWVLGSYGLAVIGMPAAMAHLADRRWPNRRLIGVGYAIAAAALAGLVPARGFAAVLGLNLLFAVGFTPMFSLLDGLTFHSLDERHRDGGSAPPYQRIRLWGSIGFMLPGVGLFMLIRWAGLDAAVAVIVAAGCAVTASLTARLLPATRPGGDEGPVKLPSAQAWRAVRRRPVAAMIGPVFLLFTAVAILYAFYTRYLQELGIGVEWAGLVVNLGVLAEIALMLVAGRLLGAVGVKGVILLGAASMAVRLGLLAAAPTIGVAIWTQLFHAPIVVCLYVVAPMYLNAKASGAWRNSMQGMFSVLCFGWARLLGSVIGGHAADFDIRWAFALASALGAVALVWALAAFRDETGCAAVRWSSGQPARPA